MMSLSSLVGSTIKKSNMSVPAVKPTNVDFSASIAPFTEVTTGTSPNIISTVSKTITRTPGLNGTYTIRCNYWPLGHLSGAFDNNIYTHADSVWANHNTVIGYNGNQRSYIGPAYDSLGNYLFGSTFFTTSGGTNYIGDYIDVYYPMSVIMKKYRFLSRWGTGWNARHARQLYFFGSNDNGTTWIYLHSYLKTSNASGVYEEIPFPTTTNSYNLYRMVINSVNSLGSPFWNIGELNMIFDVA
jgi:hypothetical protein